MTLSSLIAVEPDPEIARRAAENIAPNGLANARVIQAAASAATGETVSLYRAADLFGYAPELLADPAQCPFGRLADAAGIIPLVAHRDDYV